MGAVHGAFCSSDPVVPVSADSVWVDDQESGSALWFQIRQDCMSRILSLDMCFAGSQWTACSSSGWFAACGPLDFLVFAIFVGGAGS
ncbi:MULTISPECIES: hypothetical protein [unclassified Haematospirillum]|uniref:hypothetical protein n=1 Tax=unclassified Haematospirillum TaxID=2622088 RepID=UPI001439E437|nr:MULTISPECIES: hypothetical protein [unclassified Haematospirillum]NKD54937.1 hypothetical protein [Haematospirillum sp. H4890]NKD74958.1 hypothetical protein [Haematospirillum sp. H4485]NKD88507.1 hypothetical protein [Haematospirillum sp. 15-248]